MSGGLINASGILGQNKIIHTGPNKMCRLIALCLIMIPLNLTWQLDLVSKVKKNNKNTAGKLAGPANCSCKQFLKSAVAREHVTVVSEILTGD